MVTRSQLWWAELHNPQGSEPGFRRPVLIVQSDNFNVSHINTVIVIALTSNMRLAEAPGNVSLMKSKTGLIKDSVANVSQIITLDKTTLSELIGTVHKSIMNQVDDGIKLVLDI